ncbi:uncharacterized protein LOC9633020 isoform X1 [Selaginella moellendorffii]|nr:uncharacterized protein LOC9633020 isoform X1 [Selaginella moellendorffii]|eukprot:XP_002961301.2 uncharacterized protein LOC9633020 isoform X1 [Selaginella moellendorffii]
MEGHESSMAPPEVGDRTPYAGSGGSSSKLKLKKGSSSSARISTPYERPAAAARHPRQAAALAESKEGWIGGRIVGSASRILTKSATFLYTSLFKRQAPAIAAPPRPNAEVELDGTGDDIPSLELAFPSNEQVAKDDRDDARLENGPCDPVRVENGPCDPVEADDLESILVEKELTREQCERYIKLIRSRFYGDEHVSKPSTSVSRAQRWTPIQVPISGGRELLKKRDSAENSSPLARGTKDLSPTGSMSFRGPSILPSVAQKRKPHADSMDLTCFRKTKERTGFKLSAPSQSTRTAGRILDTLEKSPFRDLDARKTTEASRVSSGKRVTAAENVLSSTDTVPENPPLYKTKRGGLAPLTGLSTSSSFTFPSTRSRSGPEPPTPKIPSPPSVITRDQTKTRSVTVSFANGTASDIDKFAARVEKASSILEGNFGGGGAPSLTSSPSASGFEAGSSSRFLAARGDDDGKKTISVAFDPAKEKEHSLFEAKSEKFLVGAQSPAPPDSNPPNSSNGGFSVVAGPEKISKRKKSAKRMR